MSTLSLKPECSSQPLANRQEEIALANAIYKRHKSTFHHLWSILAQDVDDRNLQALVQAEQDSAKAPLKLEVELAADHTEQLEGRSGAELIRTVITFLDNKDKMPALPYSTGGKRYLVAEEAVHPSGKPFKGKSEISGKHGNTYYVETNSSRTATVKYALEILKTVGFKVSVVEE